MSVSHRVEAGVASMDVVVNTHDSGRQSMLILMALENPKTEEKIKFGHEFSSIGSGDWREFLLSIDDGYAEDKFLGHSGKDIDFLKTAKSIKAFVRSKDANLSNSAKKEIKAAVDKSVENFEAMSAELASQKSTLSASEYKTSVLISKEVCISGLMYLLRDHGFDDVGGFIQRSENDRHKTFFSKVWSPLKEALTQEIDLEKAQATKDEDAPVMM